MEKPIEHGAHHSAQPSSTVTIPRVMFNYVVIAGAFLLLGIVLGAIGYERMGQSNVQENQKLIQAAVASAVQANSQAVQAMIDKSVASLAGGAVVKAPDPNQRYEIPVDNHPSIGSPDAPVTIVEFSDFRCTYCGKFARETLQPLLTRYEGKVRFVYRNFIIFGQASFDTALAAYCSGDQNQFWNFHNLAFSHQQELGRDEFIQFATQLKLDVATFTDCLDKQTHRQQIVDDTTYSDSLGLQGTPAFFVNGRLISGAQPLDTWVGIIDAELARTAAQDAVPESTVMPATLG